MEQFTASEVRELAATIWPDLSGREEVAETLNAFADLLEAREKAVPMAWRTFDGEGNYDYRDYENNEHYRDWYVSRNGAKYANWVEPLYTHPSPSDADRLAEALRELLGDIDLVKCDFCKCHTWCSVEDSRKSLIKHEAHSAQAQPQIQCNHAGRIICGTVHEGHSEVAWCNDCGEITHGSDATPTQNLPKHEDWCKKNVVAFGCLREIDGESACKTWCGHGNHCAVTLRDDCRKSSTAQAQPPAASVPDAETLRLHLGELTPDEVCVAKAAYRLALAAQENPNG